MINNWKKNDIKNKKSDNFVFFNWLKWLTCKAWLINMKNNVAQLSKFVKYFEEKLYIMILKSHLNKIIDDM